MDQKDEHHGPFEFLKGNYQDKTKFYHDLFRQAQSLLEDETDLIANAANLSSLIYHELNQQEPKNRVNWSGFYFMRKGMLVLGPFQGKPACIRIKVGKGVCGTAVSKKQTMRVDDVHKFPGHIACDSVSNSEIVIPLKKTIDGEDFVLGVLDIDSSIVSGFDEHDQSGLESIINEFMNNSKVDWKAFYLENK